MIFQTSFDVLLVVVTPRVERDLRQILEPFGYRVNVVHDGKAALSYIREGKPDIIISEIKIPVLSGYDLCRIVKKDIDTRIIPFVMITSFYNVDSKVKGFHAGVDDFFYYPFQDIEIRARVSSLLRVKNFYEKLKLQKEHLDLLIQKRTKELSRLTKGLISALEKANTLNDADTGFHIIRVSNYAEILGKTFGADDFYVSELKDYASLHDVGKVGLPDSILRKEGRLTPSEFEAMKLHTTFGYELLKEAGVSEIAQNIAKYHHERWDGGGYPDGLKGKEIPLEARIVAVADVFDALTTKRSYKQPVSLEYAKQLIVHERGKHFDPDLVECFVFSFEKFVEIFYKFNEEE